MAGVHQVDPVWDEILAGFQEAAAEVADDVWNQVFGDSAASQQPADSLTLAFTGILKRNQHCVEINGEPAWVPSSLFDALVKLAIARLQADAEELAFAQLGDEIDKEAVQQIVSRVRKAIDAAAGIEGLGAELIQHCAATEYSLEIPKEGIFVHSRLSKLAPTHLSEEAAATILSLAAPNAD